MKLPNPPSLRQIEAHVPRIPPVPAGLARPLWSVMIPTYNCVKYLRRTLASVLSQDPGPDAMQIEVVDGGSTEADPEGIVNELGAGRVAFSRLPQNRGPAHTFNRCIERSRGHWVHILHGDDMVLPGFYETYGTALQQHPDAHTVVGEVLTIDASDQQIGLSGSHFAVAEGLCTEFARAQATRQLVFCPGVVVRRAAYEAVGGFCTLFDHVTDWDMWFRLGQCAPVACVEKPYAMYRIHNGSETSKLVISASNIQESYFVVKANLARLGAFGAGADGQWRSRIARAAETTAWRLDGLNSSEGRYNQARWAWMLEPTRERFIMLAKSWLKHRLQRARVSSWPGRSSSRLSTQP